MSHVVYMTEELGKLRGYLSEEPMAPALLPPVGELAFARVTHSLERHPPQ